MNASFTPKRKVIAVFDLSGFAKSFQKQGDERMALLIHDYYMACEEVVRGRGGEVVKFIGDACLATFEPENATQAVEAARAMQACVAELSKKHGIPTALGANVHLASAIEGDYGAGPSRRRDIIGRGVNQTFLLGRGEGIRISEPVYRALPSSARSPWSRYRPPAVYHLETSGEIYAGGGKDPASNAQRW